MCYLRDPDSFRIAFFSSRRMQARNLKVNSISHVTQHPGVQYVRKTLNSTLLMIKLEALAVLPLRPGVPLARKLGCTRAIPSVDVLVIAEDHGGPSKTFCTSQA